MVSAKILAGRIKRARAGAGLSQKDLAEHLHFSDKTVSAYETGRAIPPVPTLQKIAELTNTPLEKLVNGEEDRKSITNKELAEKLDIIIRQLQEISNKL